MLRPHTTLAKTALNHARSTCFVVLSPAIVKKNSAEPLSVVEAAMTSCSISFSHHGHMLRMQNRQGHFTRILLSDFGASGHGSTTNVSFSDNQADDFMNNMIGNAPGTLLVNISDHYGVLKTTPSPASTKSGLERCPCQ